MAAATFEELEVWKKAHRFVLGIYKLSSRFPGDERFGLTSQLRRAAVSVPANIAEGFIKRGKSDKTRFYNISEGSVEECRYYLILARDLGFADTTELMKDLEEVSRMLRSYIAAILASRFSARGFIALFSFLLLASCSLLLKRNGHG
jgi:four helix bundle protein